MLRKLTNIFWLKVTGMIHYDEAHTLCDGMMAVYDDNDVTVEWWGWTGTSAERARGNEGKGTDLSTH